MNKNLITAVILCSTGFGASNSLASPFEENTVALNEQQIEKKALNTPIKKSIKNEADEKITVTGSRLRRDSFTVATPMTIIGTDAIEDSGLGSMAEILTDVIPSINPSSSPGNTQNNLPNSGLSTISLRNLGANRTLTLIDGRRVVSNSYRANMVSLGTIPSGMVKKVEIITGGSSAIYGSDAISGVVNIITQNSKEGFSISTRAGESYEGGAKQFSVNADYGSSFDDDRGYAFFSSSWNRDFGLKATDRERALISDSYTYNNTEMCNAMQVADGTRPCMRDITQADWTDLSDGRFSGVFLEHSRNDKQFWYDDQNVLRDDWKGNEERYGINYSQWNLLQVPNTSFVNALKIDYDITDDISSYFQVHYSQNNSISKQSPRDSWEANNAPTFDLITGKKDPVNVSMGYIPIDNPYVPQEILDSNPWRDRIYWDRRFPEVGFRSTENTRDTLRTWGGLNGTMFDGDWDWDVSVGYGVFTQTLQRKNSLNIQKVRNALNANYADDGVTIQCADADARAAGCAPLNLFGLGSISAEAADYIRANPRIKTEIKQMNALAYITGDLFELPAGPVATAFGVEYRKDSQDVKPSEEFRTGGTTYLSVPQFYGEVDVYEAFGEAAFPLLRDVVGAKSLTAEVSARVADYSMKNVGTVVSWKTGLTWEPIDNYTVRANFARSQRAPDITELLSPPRSDFGGFTDPCRYVTATSTDNGHANCRLEPTIAAAIAADGEFTENDNNFSPNGGNVKLTEETGDTFTVGITMAPEFISGFRMAVDYYDITVSDAISSLREEQILERCYDSPVGTPWGSDNEYCQLITRDTDGALIEVIQNVQNLNELTSKGYDVAAEYVFNVADLGSFTLKADMTHIIERSQTSVDEGVTLKEEYSGYLGTFKDKASASLTWRMDNLRLRWRTMYRGPVVDSRSRETFYYEPLNADGDGGVFLENEAACQAGEASCVAKPEAPFNHKLGSYIRHDFSASYNMNISDDYNLRVYAGVNNIFDDAGPFMVFYNNNFSSNYGNGVGRYIYAGASIRF